MKKTVLLLAVCLMLGLCACGLRGQSVARNAVEPVHFSAPAVRQDAAPAEEPRVTLPQGQPADGAGAPLVRRQLLQRAACPGSQPVSVCLL